MQVCVDRTDTIRPFSSVSPICNLRSLFRTVELLDGWTGKLATDQVLFTVLDGGMILLSSILLNVFHPMFLLGYVNPPPPLTSRVPS